MTRETRTRGMARASRQHLDGTSRGSLVGNVCAALVFAAASLLPLSTPAQMTAAPRVYEVTGLSATDVLNVRSRPSTVSEDVGDLLLGASPVEVLDKDSSGRWGRILLRGSDAWVSMRYLSPIQMPRVEGTGLPSGLRCTGTEPFWSLELSAPDSLRMLVADESTTATLAAASSSINSLGFPVALLARAQATELTAIVRPARCSDGMSDQTYGWSVDLLRRDGDTLMLLSGCCRLPLTD